MLKFRAADMQNIVLLVVLEQTVLLLGKVRRELNVDRRVVTIDD